ncbi:MAG TPA: hypothetical protein VK597_11725, partial [Inquilinus sp.]|nr:hypothetical protein [Inquilinus sp.]
MPMGTLELTALIVTAGSSLALLALGLRGSMGEARLRRRLTTIGDQVDAGGGLAWLRPFERVLVGGGKDREEISQALRAAGYYDPGAILVFAGLRLAAVLLATVGVGLGLWLTGRWSGMAWLYAIGSGGLVYVGAKLILRWRVSARQRRVVAEIPFVLDVLLLMLESGVSLDQCFRS